MTLLGLKHGNKSRSLMYRHLKYNHKLCKKPEKPLISPYKNLNLQSRQSKLPKDPLALNIVSEERRKPFQCDVCSARYTSKENLNRHFLIEHDD